MEEDPSVEDLKNILLSQKLNGHSNLSEKIISILKDFCGDLKKVNFDLIISLSAEIFKNLEQQKEAVPEQQTGENDSVTSSKSVSSKEQIQTEIHRETGSPPQGSKGQGTLEPFRRE